MPLSVPAPPAPTTTTGVELLVSGVVAELPAVVEAPALDAAVDDGAGVEAAATTEDAVTLLTTIERAELT